MKLAVVSGCNRGIGLALCRLLKAENFEVLGLCRQASNELKELGIEIVEQVDVVNSQRLQEVASGIKNESIDLLINNAGIMHKTSLDDLEFDKIEEQFRVNAMGPLRVFEAFREKFKPNSKLAVITSRMGSIADNGSGGAYGYRMSKSAVNAAFKSLAMDLKQDTKKISVGIIHPGFVKTEMTQNSGLIDAKQAAQGILDRINNLSLENTGQFWHSNGESLPW